MERLERRLEKEEEEGEEEGEEERTNRTQILSNSLNTDATHCSHSKSTNEGVGVLCVLCNVWG